MAQYNITSPDGAQYQVTAPDNATQDQVMAYVQQQHGAATTPQPSGMGDHVDSYLADKPGLANDIQNLLSKRVDAVNNAPDLPNFMVSSARLGVGGAADVGGAALSAIPGAGLVKSAAGAIGGGIAHAVGSIPTNDAGTTFGDVGNAFSGMMQREEAAHPLFANVMGYAQDVGNLAAQKGIVSLGRAGLNAASDAMGNAVPSTAWRGAIPSGADIDAQAQKGYDFADKSGSGVNAQGAGNYYDQAQAKAAQSPTDLLRNGPDSVQTYLNNMENARGQPLSIGDAQAEDIKLRQNATKAYDTGDNDLGERWNTIRDALNEHVYNQQDPALMTGGPEGFQALQEANRLKSQAYTIKGIENTINNGLSAEVPQQGIKQGFRQMSKNIDKYGQKGLSDETVAAIDYAGKTGALTGVLKAMGSKLGGAVGGAVGATMGTAIPIPVVGPALGGLVGTGIGLGVGAPFRAGAKAIQLSKANNVLRTIIDRPTFTPPSLSSSVPPPPTP